MGRTLHSETEDQLNFRSNNPSRNPGSDKPSEMRKEKRVRFTDSKIEGLGDHDTPKRRKVARSSPSDGPKTSEYAYFRNMKNRASSRDHSRALLQVTEGWRCSKVDSIGRETTMSYDMPKPRTQNVKSLCSGDKAGPSDNHFLLSPRVSKYDEADQLRNKDMTAKSKQHSPLFTENWTPVGQNMSLSDNTKQSRKENICTGKGIFSAKRKRLCQWVAKTLSSEVENIQTKGFDVVSSLLSRLLPKGNENDDFSRRVADNNSKYVPFRKSYKVDEGVHLSHTREWDEYLQKSCTGTTREIILPERNTSIPESSFPNPSKELNFSKSYKVDMGYHLSPTRACDAYAYLPKLNSSRTGEIVFTGQNTFVTEFPFSNPGKDAHFQDEWVDLDQPFKSIRYRSLPTLCDFSSFLPFERYRSSDSWCIKEVDKFFSPIKRARNEPHRLSLGWDLEREEEGVESSIINYENAGKWDLGSTTSWHIDHQHNNDGVLVNRPLYSSSFANYYLPPSESMPNYQSTSYLTQDLGPIYEAVKYAAAEEDPFDLSSHGTPKCITRPVYRGNAEDMLHRSNITLTSGDHSLPTNELCLDKSRNDFCGRMFSGPHLSDVWQFPPVDSFSRMEEAPGELFTMSNVFFNHSRPSNVQSSLHRIITRPLTLGNVNPDSPEQEFYFHDDYESRYSQYCRHG